MQQPIIFVIIVCYKVMVITPCFTKKRNEPTLPVSAATSIPVLTTTSDVDIQSLWTICRGFFNADSKVPDWSGWISKTAEHTSCGTKSRIGYMAPLMNPITDYSTVQQCLVLSKEVSLKLKQEYTLVTMDLAAAKIAFDIVWGSGDQFSKVIVNLGPFHIMCSYMGALGKMLTGSGFEEIVLEAGICASGSINQVMSGKHYNRAIRVHLLMLDSLQRLLLDAYTESTGHLLVDETVSKLASCPSYESLLDASRSTTYLEFVEPFRIFKDRVRAEEFGKTAKFWLQYCDCVWVLLEFQRSVKVNNFDLFLRCMKQMCSLLFSADHLHYARYLPLYYVQLSQLAECHPLAHTLLKDCGFSVSRSIVPACRNAVDLTIEQTINRSAKTPGGIVGFSRNVAAYQRWCLTRHKRAEYVEATMEEVDMLTNTSEVHKSCLASHIKRSESDVGKLVVTFHQFLNPFKLQGINKEHLFCLSSGKSASDVVASDLVKYVEVGTEAAQNFIVTRLLEKTVKFQDTIKRRNLKTFQAMAKKCTISTATKKTVQVKAERNLLGRLLMLSQTHNISFEKLFKYPLAPIPWALATVDADLVKTDKSQLLHCLEAKVEPVTTQPLLDTATYIIDGNAQIQALSSLPESFEDFAFNIFCGLPKAKVVHFVTDTYRDDSIKQLERNRRGISQIFNIGGSKTKLPRDFKSFLMNGNNKRQLIRLLLDEWCNERYAGLFNGRQVFFVCEEQCMCLNSSDGYSVTCEIIKELCSDQEEADTRIVLHCLYAARSSCKGSSIIVRSPDTDVFVILISYSTEIMHDLFFDTGHGNKRRLIKVQDIKHEIGCEIATALPGLHAFTGCDSTSAFMRKGKKGPLQILRRYTQYVKVFQQLGEEAKNLSEIDLSSLERFVCAMYGKPTFSDIDKVRCAMFQSRYEPKSSQKTFSISNGIDLSLLPPCKSSLRMHSLRANYQCYIWKHSHIALTKIPSPIGSGWKQNDADSVTPPSKSTGQTETLCLINCWTSWQLSSLKATMKPFMKTMKAMR